jgi:head-tail adaptor
MPNVDILHSGLTPLQLYSYLRMYVFFRMFLDADNIRVREVDGPNRDVQGEMLTVWREFDYLWDWLRAVVHNRERMLVPVESVITAEMTIVGRGLAILADWVFYVNRHLQRIFGDPPPVFYMHENVGADVRFEPEDSRIWWTGAYVNVVSATRSLSDYVRFLVRR